MTATAARKAIGAMLFCFALVLLAPQVSVAERRSLDGHPALGGNEAGMTVLSVHDDNETELHTEASAAIPPAYSSVDKGYVTPVRNQRPFDTCWAFANIAAVESSMLARVPSLGYSRESLDLSERHAAYFPFNMPPDALGNTDGDKLIPIKEKPGFPLPSYLSNGGHHFFVAHSLWSGVGPVSEAKEPYKPLCDGYAALPRSPQVTKESLADFLMQTALAPETGREGVASLRAAKFISMRDVDLVKRAIMEYGGVSISMHYSESFMKWGPNKNSPSYYYQDTSEESNHMVEVVGWNDNLGKDLFGSSGSSGTKPENDGAWLCKNSWGTEYDNGYFWLSYEDKYTTWEHASAWAYEMEAVRPLNIYQYDGTAAWLGDYVESGGCIANVFEARACESGEKLQNISFEIDDVNVDYEVQVYLNPSDPHDPKSGEPILKTPVLGKTSCMGIYRVDIPEEVPLLPDTRFSVVVSLSHANGSRVRYGTDGTWGKDRDANAWYESISAVKEGQSFRKEEPDGEWIDLAESNNSARIKATTANARKGEYLDINNASIAPVPSQTYTGKGVRPLLDIKIGPLTLNQGVDYTVEYRNNVKAGSASAVVIGKGKFYGTRTVSFQIVSPQPPAILAKVTMHRLYNPNSGEHFYTANNGEKNTLASIGWNYEGTGWIAPKSSSKPVYRLYNENAGDHHYTMSKGERDSLVSVGWKYEGIGWYSAESNGRPLYRQYNPNALAGSHNYTTNKSENDSLVQLGWRAEGIGWYGVK